MKSKLIIVAACFVFFCQSCAVKTLSNQLTSYQTEGYKLVWADEFNIDGVPDPKKWTYEHGFVRNEELQWYQPENAFCKNGLLIIEARKEIKVNPTYVEGSTNWRQKRKTIAYTSACLLTKGLQSWQYGRFEMRAKIDISAGLWPAFWTLGLNKPWPSNGEIDIMEYYKGNLLANIASLGKNGGPKWFSTTKPIIELGGKKWANQFHVWRMDWNSESISLYVDNQLLNQTNLNQLINDDGSNFNPFMQPHFMLLNLAMGGINGGELTGTKFPNRMEVDYVRVYQR